MLRAGEGGGRWGGGEVGRWGALELVVLLAFATCYIALKTANLILIACTYNSTWLLFQGQLMLFTTYSHIHQPTPKELGLFEC